MRGRAYIPVPVAFARVCGCGRCVAQRAVVFPAVLITYHIIARYTQYSRHLHALDFQLPGFNCGRVGIRPPEHQGTVEQDDRQPHRDDVWAQGEQGCSCFITFIPGMDCLHGKIRKVPGGSVIILSCDCSSIHASARYGTPGIHLIKILPPVLATVLPPSFFYCRFVQGVSDTCG